MTTPDTPDFTSPKFLERHIQSTLAFYAPRVLAPDGGFRGCFLDDGTSFDPDARYLVGSARYVLNYATASRFHDDPTHLQWAERGLNFLNTVHKQENGHYAWRLENGVVTDSRVMAYGHAFVLLAAASCLRAGISSARTFFSDAVFMASVTKHAKDIQAKGIKRAIVNFLDGCA